MCAPTTKFSYRNRYTLSAVFDVKSCGDMISMRTSCGPQAVKVMKTEAAFMQHAFHGGILGLIRPLQALSSSIF